MTLADSASPAGLPALAAVISALPLGWAAAACADRFVTVGEGLPPSLSILLQGLGALWALSVMPNDWTLAAALGLFWALSVLACIDVLALRLPDVFTLTLAAAGLLASFWLPGRPIIDHLAGAAAGYGVLALLEWAYRRVRGRPGLGMGDAKLLAAAGAWLGWQALPSVLLIACAGGLVWALAAAPSREGGAQQPIPFGAPLCLAIWLVWLYGPLQL